MFDESSPQSPASPMRWIGLPLCLLILLLFVVLVGFYGCNGNSSNSNSSTTEGGGSPPTGGGRDLLDVALDMMQPNRLGIDSPPERAASVLNQWRLAQMESAKKESKKRSDKDRFSPPLPAETRKYIESQLSAEAVKEAEADDFSQRDVAHIRTSLLMKAIVDDQTKGLDSDVERAGVLFDFVTRNVQLVAEDDALPLTPYEMLIFGEGTAADRAWIFAGLLRQLKLDAVIVRTPSKEAPWFVGAIVNRKVHLFDPLRSTPVPQNPQAAPAKMIPATLSDLADPAVWKALVGEEGAQKFPKLFENVKVEIIGTSEVWAPRLVRLERFLTGDSSVVISENLMASSQESSSVLDRVAAAGSSRWSRDDIRVWPHPENRLRGFENLDPGKLQERQVPFQAPLFMEKNPQTKQIILGRPLKLELKTRTQQLMGRRDEAVRGYLQVQLDYKNIPAAAPLPPAIRSMHAEAAEDALFWGGVCQMEMDNPQGAARTFETYLAKAEEFLEGRHTDHCRVLWAICLAERKQSAKAIEVLKPIKPSSPESASATFLKSAWGGTETSNAKAPKSAPPEPQTNPPQSQPNQPAIAEKPQ